LVVLREVAAGWVMLAWIIIIIIIWGGGGEERIEEKRTLTHYPYWGPFDGFTCFALVSSLENLYDGRIGGPTSGGPKNKVVAQWHESFCHLHCGVFCPSGGGVGGFLIAGGDGTGNGEAGSGVKITFIMLVPVSW